MLWLQEDTDLGSAAKPRGRAPRCIILAPTRELAQQVQREFAEAAPSLAVGVFYGGAWSAHCITRRRITAYFMWCYCTSAHARWHWAAVAVGANRWCQSDLVRDPSGTRQFQARLHLHGGQAPC